MNYIVKAFESQDKSERGKVVYDGNDRDEANQTLTSEASSKYLRLEVYQLVSPVKRYYPPKGTEPAKKQAKKQAKGPAK
ncbi:MAG: hypothetical protein AAFX93_20400 [Verrucomicrobiota bacterium]